MQLRVCVVNLAMNPFKIVSGMFGTTGCINAFEQVVALHTSPDASNNCKQAALIA